MSVFMFILYSKRRKRMKLHQSHNDGKYHVSFGFLRFLIKGNLLQQEDLQHWVDFILKGTSL